MYSLTPWADARKDNPDFDKIMERINLLASLERKLTCTENAELKSLNEASEDWAKRLDLH